MTLEIRLFVSHSFSDHDHLMDVASFRTVIDVSCENSSAALSTKHNIDVNISPYFEDEGFGKVLPSQIRKEIIASDIFMIDIAGATPNTFYELGFAHAKGKGLIVLEAVSEGSIAKPIPADISDLLIGRYNSTENLSSKLSPQILEYAEASILTYRRAVASEESRCFWFQGEPAEIHIICAPEPERTRFAEATSADYLFVDNLEDRDALFEVSNFLSRSYPKAKIFRHSSGNISADVLGSNLVVLGGPHNNSATRDLMGALNTSFEYVDSDNSIKIKLGSRIESLSSVKNSEGMLIKDVGYFGWFLNPFNRENRVVMCHGCHTFGTLGSSIIFADNNIAIENQNRVKDYISLDFNQIERLESIFEILILENRRITTPIFNTNYSFTK